MAFCQPTAAPQRQKNVYETTDNSLISTQHARVDDSQQWILFSPTHAQTHTDTETQTAGRSRISDFGSFNTVAHSNRDEVSELLDDDEELDSLDDGLHAFQEPSVYNGSRRLDQSGGTILPVHDGLGTFAASSSRVQEQLWSFEHYNPRRRSIHQRRRSSLQRKLEAIEDEDAVQMESSRVERIEKWRMDQSKALLEEIEKETRRRRDSRVSESAHDQTRKSTESMPKADDEKQDATHLRKTTSTSEDFDPVESETFLERITRRVIQDLMGIDDSILSAILGESLLSETPVSITPKHASTPLRPAINPPPSESAKDSKPSFMSSWEDRLLTRLARELGILVHQLSEHPDAFSTYRPPPMDYAGIPVTQHTSLNPPSRQTTPLNSRPSLSTTFRPTLQDHILAPSDSDHAARWGIEDSHPDDAATSSAAEIEYWEQTPDLKAVFNYLHQRFTSQQSSPVESTQPATQTIAIATSNSPASLRRAAIIRQQHPLISRSSAYGRQKPNLRRGSLHMRRYSNSLQHQYNHSSLQSPSLKRPGSSCASLSTKKSRRESKRGSEHYWDIDFGGGGSEVLGGVGVWVEV